MAEIYIDPMDGFSKIVARMSVNKPLPPAYRTFLTFWCNRGDMNNYLVFQVWQMKKDQIAVDVIYYTEVKKKVLMSNNYEYTDPADNYPTTTGSSSNEVTCTIAIDRQLMKLFAGIDADKLFGNVEIDYGLNGDWSFYPEESIELFNDRWLLVGAGIVVGRHLGLYEDIDNFIFQNSIHRMNHTPIASRTLLLPPASIPLKIESIAKSNMVASCGGCKLNHPGKDCSYVCHRNSLAPHGFNPDVINVERASQRLTPQEIYNADVGNIYEHFEADDTHKEGAMMTCTCLFLLLLVVVIATVIGYKYFGKGADAGLHCATLSNYE